jgi:hypothetical protein
MPSSRLIYVDILDALSKLESTAGAVKFRLFIPRGEMRIGRPTRIWSASNGTNMLVVIGTASMTAVAKLKVGEHVPEGAVTTTYFKV